MTPRADHTKHTLRLVNNHAAATPHTSIRPNIRGRFHAHPPASPSPTPAPHHPPPPTPLHASVSAQTADLSPVSQSDPRWAFAVLVASRIEGGRAAILRPEVRERLVCLGKKLGIRPFDAALTIAMVQDAARRGQAPGQVGAESSSLAERLGAITKPASKPPQPVGHDILSKAASALFLATALLGLAIMWVQMNP